MMEDHEFCDSCEGCRPAIASVDPVTGKVGPALPRTSPPMRAIDEYWDNHTSYEERKSYIEVTLHNSRRSIDMERTRKLTDAFQKLLSELPDEPDQS